MPILSVGSVSRAVPLAATLMENGVTTFEVLLRTPDALQIASEMQRAFPAAHVGLGTLRTPDDVARARDAGLAFGVSPGLTDALAQAAADLSLPLLAGVQTASEVMTAVGFGLRTLKLFPANVVGGLDWLDAIAPVFPDITFCPTGGIGPSQIPAYLARKNCVAVGGSWVAPRDLIAESNWESIGALARTAAKFSVTSSDRP